MRIDIAGRVADPPCFSFGTGGDVGIDPCGKDEAGEEKKDFRHAFETFPRVCC